MSAAHFLQETATALIAGTFRRLTLARPASGETRRNIHLRPVTLKDGVWIQIVQTYPTRDETENVFPSAALRLLETTLGSHFRDAHLEAESFTLSLRFGKKGTPHLSRKNVLPKFGTNVLQHDREKKRLLEPSHLPWLTDLGLADANGRILPSRSAKWRQVERFIELLDHAWRDLAWSSDRPLRVHDLGSGKGYLTFAVEAWLTDHLAVSAEVRGIEQRPALVALSNSIAEKNNRPRLRFVEGSIEDFREPGDLLIALHACNTATDDALALGLRHEAAMIVCAPCCQHELRGSMQGSEAIAGLFEHGLLRQRQAALVTDSLRSLLLEREGYHVRIVEFVSSEETDKNLLLIATRTGKKSSSAAKKIGDLKTIFGISSFYLETLLA